MSVPLREASDPSWARACEQKARHRTELCARVAERRHLNNCDERGESAPDRLYVYACLHCRGWHLTKSRNGGAAVTRAELREGVPS